MSVWHDIKSAVNYTDDDGYQTMLQDAMQTLSALEKDLFREESSYVLLLHDGVPYGTIPTDILEQKVMERFAEEEAARP